MYSSGYLLLQQSEFLSNYVGSFQDLRSAGELFDVTLACEDETLEAHKVVISACSPFFRHVLTKTKQNHPFIYLKGVLHKDLVALLDYIYTGETQVPAEDVNRFIEAAKELKIKGLTTEEDESSDKDIPPDTNGEKKQEQIKEEIMEITPFFNTDDELNFFNGSSGSEEQIVGTLEEEIAKRAHKIKNNSGKTMWKCEECGKVLKAKDKLAAHIESHLKGFSHLCTICDRKYKTRNSLSSHIFQMHKGKSEIKEEKVDKGDPDDALNDSDLKTNNLESLDEKDQEDKLRNEISNRMEKVLDTAEGIMWKCTECGKIVKRKDLLELHVETHIEGFSQRCVHCDKTCKTRGSLKIHISTFHKEDK